MSLSDDEFKRELILRKIKNLESACSRMFNRRRIL